MDTILKMAADAGMTPEQGEAATGSIMAFAKKNLDSEQYNQIVSKIPAIDGLVKKEEAEAKDRASGGGNLMSSLASLGGGAGGGSGTSGGGAAGGAAGVAMLISVLGKYGITANQVNAFLPQIVSLVKKQSGVDIGSFLGVSSSGSAAGTGGSQTTGGTSSNPNSMLSSAMGMFGGKK